MIAVSTGVLVPAPEIVSETPVAGTITIEQLGLFTAVLMRWPALAGALAVEPRLFSQMPNGTEFLLTFEAKEKDDILRVITFDPTYDISKLDLGPLLMVMPDAFSGTLRGRSPEQARSQLVGSYGGPSGEGRANNAPRADGTRSEFPRLA